MNIGLDVSASLEKAKMAKQMDASKEVDPG
jgi:hypothetical protein